MNSAIQVPVTTKQSSKLPKLRDGHTCRKGTLYMNTYKKLSAKLLLLFLPPFPQELPTNRNITTDHNPLCNYRMQKQELSHDEPSAMK